MKSEELYKQIIQDPEINVVHPVLEALLRDCCESVICCCMQTKEENNMVAIAKAAYLLAIMDFDQEIKSAFEEDNEVSLVINEQEFQLSKSLLELQELTFFE